MNYLQHNKLPHTVSLDEIKENIIGYNTQITTPFGELLAFYADHTATSRPYRAIEKIISEQIKPMIANAHTESSTMGEYCTQLLNYSQNSILKSHHVGTQTHFCIPVGMGSTGAFERSFKMMKIEKRCELASQVKDIPLIFMSPYEHHSNILPWVNAKCEICPIDSDEFGNMNLEWLRQQLLSNLERKCIVISVSACSNVTSQKTNIQAINSIIKEFKRFYRNDFYFQIDAAAFASHDRVNLSDYGISQCDFLAISPHKHIGGTESTGILIVKNQAYNKNDAPSFPGGGTVKFVVGYQENDIKYTDEPFGREMPGTPNSIGFYRAALTFELQDMIGIELIKTREHANAHYFMDRIQKINQDLAKQNREIKIYGEQVLDYRLGVFSFNIYGPGTTYDHEGKTLFHPNLVARVLNDVFGIQVRSGCSCTGPFGIKLLKLNDQQVENIYQDILRGSEDTKPGWVRIDTNFLFCKHDMEYLITAIEYVARYTDKLAHYYKQNEKSGQFYLPQYKPLEKHWNLTCAMQDPMVHEYPNEMRKNIQEQQLKRGLDILLKPEIYLSQIENINQKIHERDGECVSPRVKINKKNDYLNGQINQKEESNGFYGKSFSQNKNFAGNNNVSQLVDQKRNQQLMNGNRIQSNPSPQQILQQKFSQNLKTDRLFTQENDNNQNDFNSFNKQNNYNQDEQPHSLFKNHSSKIINNSQNQQQQQQDQQQRNGRFINKSEIFLNGASNGKKNENNKNQLYQNSSNDYKLNAPFGTDNNQSYLPNINKNQGNQISLPNIYDQIGKKNSFKQQQYSVEKDSFNVMNNFERYLSNQKDQQSYQINSNGGFKPYRNFNILTGI